MHSVEKTSDAICQEQQWPLAYLNEEYKKEIASNIPIDEYEHLDQPKYNLVLYCTAAMPIDLL